MAAAMVLACVVWFILWLVNLCFGLRNFEDAKRWRWEPVMQIIFSQVALAFLVADIVSLVSGAK